MKTNKKNIFTPLEKSLLELALKDDDRLRNENAKQLFEIQTLTTVVQHIREKLSKVLKQEYSVIINDVLYIKKGHRYSSKGKKIQSGIYRLSDKYKPIIKNIINSIE